jgi:hypothetical protein
MILRFTEKLSKKLKLGPITKVERDAGPFLEWYANLFTANRTQYILVTEVKSLLSIVMYGRGVVDDNIFINHFLNFLREYLDNKGNRLIFERVIGPSSGQITMSKTASKSILGSMNDMVSMSKFTLEREDVSPMYLTEMINKTPFKAIDYQSPLEAFGNLKVESSRI